MPGVHRSVLVAVTVIAVGACSPSTSDTPKAAHGGRIAERALANAAFHWAVREGPGFHLHYPADSTTAGRIDRLYAAAERAVEHDLATFGEPDTTGPLELLLVDSREQAALITGNPSMGRAVEGELTAVFVAGMEAAPAFRHEVAHVLTLDQWGDHRSGSWIAEGVAMWAAGDCLGLSLDSLAAGYLRQGRLPEWSAMEANFWELDEVAAYIAAGSLIGELERQGGIGAVERLWRDDVWPAPVAEVEEAWRERLAEEKPAYLAPGQLRYGCEAQL